MRMSSSIVGVGRYRLVIAMHTAEDPSAQEWSEFERMLEPETSQKPTWGATLRCLAVSDGGAPSTRQRHSLLNETLRGSALKTALLTDVLSNPFKRGIVKALSWMNPGFKAFGSSELPQALAYLDLTPELEVVWSVLSTLQAQFPALITLDRAAVALARPRLPSLGRLARG